MNSVFVFLLLLFTTIPCTFIKAQELNPDFNQALSDSLGGDDYGMKSYVLVILRTGSKVIENKDERALIFKGHMDNIKRLAEEGKLVVAGPFGKNDLTYRGLFILNVKTSEEAKIICDTDPAVKAGIFDVDLIPWYGSAALGEYIAISKKIARFKM